MKKIKLHSIFYCFRELNYLYIIRYPMFSYIHNLVVSFSRTSILSYTTFRKIFVTLCMLLISVQILCSCGKSKETQFYLLTSLPPQKNAHNYYNKLQIGIDGVNIPDYIKKPQLMIHQTPHHLTIEELNQWASPLDKNITLVLATNLSTLLPGAIVQSAPWDNKFHPDYHLQIEMSQFAIDINGASILRAEYIIYQNEKLIYKGNVYYHSTTPVVTTEALVKSMNTNLTHLTEEIARFFKKNNPKFGS